MLKNPYVSVVIVCMNNLKNLTPCLDSIIKNTSLQIEIYVVSYLFPEEKIAAVKKAFPSVFFIPSNKIRGFSENNNIALKKCKGKYCFILNDDTYFDTHVIDNLFFTIENIKNASVISPVTINIDGSLQSCGRPKLNMLTYILTGLQLYNEQKTKSKYTYQKGIFQSYNIVGAAFMIKREVFEKIGFFDETYFFCPEDIDVSTKLNKIGYKCYVNSNIKITHTGSGSSHSMIQTATLPAQTRGEIIFYSGRSFFLRLIFRGYLYLYYSIKYIYYKIKSAKGNKHFKIRSVALKNSLCIINSKKMPKDIFIEYYNKIQNRS
jgi:GT2 family glycosyltransferase